ncbi:MAG: hypothetical protein HGJ93_02965 [Desulfosarcina sp.]|nr:hypothetical protein [Desulfosarcina sp.]MBC2764934.1 hypothetical protein [Desulfosarcina sp.]
MVTIDPDKSILNTTELKKAEGLSKTQKGEFDAIFRKAVDSTEIKSANVESTNFVSEIRPAQFTTEPMPSANMVVDRVQRLIDAMEAYQQKLIENGATLKDIQPLMEKMASQSESLTAISNAVGEQDDLRTIVNQSLMLSSMEIAKYKSGLYNP